MATDLNRFVRPVMEEYGGRITAAEAELVKPVVYFTATNVAIPEGNSGNSTLRLTARRSSLAGTMAVTGQFDPGTTNADDYPAGLPGDRVWTFADGSDTATVDILIKGDTAIEPNDTLGYQLLTGGAYRLGSPSRITGTITNDDTAGSGGAPVVPSPGGAATTRGLIYRDPGSLSDWSAPSGTYIELTTPAIVPSVRSAIVAQAPGPIGTSDYGGNREGFLFEDTDGTWYIFYGAGNGSETGNLGPWRPQVSRSNDRGVTWTKMGQLSPVLSKGYDATNWAAVDMLFFEKRGTKYYLHRLTAGTVAVNQICGQPYTSDVWSADSPLGTYTYVGRTVESGQAGSPDATDAYASCMVLYQGVYHLFYSSTSADREYNCGLSTGPTPYGPFTKVSAALIPNGIKMQPENPEVYFDARLNLWVMLVNQVNKTAEVTDRNRVFFSANLTDWSAATFNELQQIGPGDGSDAIGMARIKRNADNLPDFDVFGNYGVIYDADPARLDYGKHTRRSLFYSQLEPFAKGYGVVAPGAGSAIFSETFLSYTAGDLGGQGGWVDQSGTSAKPQVVVVDANTKYLDMRSSVGPSAVSRSTDKLPAKNAKYTGRGRFGVNCGVGFGFGWAPNTAFFRVDIVRSTGQTTNLIVNFIAVDAAGVETNRTQQTVTGIPENTDFTFVIAQTGTIVSASINGQAPVTHTLSGADEATTNRDGGIFLRNGFGAVGDRFIRTLAIAPAEQNSATVLPMMRAQAHDDFVAEFAIRPVSMSGVMEFIYRSQSAANRDNCYRINISVDGVNIAATSATKLAAGVATDFAGAAVAGRSVLMKEGFYSRFRVEVVGNLHRVYVDNQLQLEFTDGTYTSGLAVGFNHLSPTTRMDRRGLSMYKPGGVTVRGLTAGDIVTLRGASGIPLTSITATGATATLNARHFPCDRIDVNNATRYRPVAGIWGGDVYG